MRSLWWCNEEVITEGPVRPCRSSSDPDRFIIDGWLWFFHEFLSGPMVLEIRSARALLYRISSDGDWGHIFFHTREYLALC
jgi:hypothetical protein